MKRAALIALLLTLTGPAYAKKVRIRGGAQLKAQATFVSAGELLELRGIVVDDAAAPIESAWIDLTTKGELRVGDARACAGPRANLAPLTGGIKVQSGANGEFCLQWAGAPERGTLALRFGGDRYHGAAELDVEFDRTKPQRLATTLRFDPRPIVLDLDKEDVAVSAVLDLSLPTVHAARSDLPIELVDDRGAELGRTRTGGDGKVHFQLDAAKLGAPGAGRLVVRFAGSSDLAPAADEQPITRRATVTLELAEDVQPTDPGDSATIQLVLRSKTGAVDGGVVEALQDGAAVGSAPVREGRAELTVAVDPRHTGPAELTVRYLPSAPYYRAGQPIDVTVPLAPPSVLLRALLAVVVLAAAAWVTLSWRRSRRPPTLRPGRPLLTPGVHVVHSVRGAKSWKGTVVDAHEGVPLAGVSVLVRAPTLEEDDVLVSMTTDARGLFAFDLPNPPEGAEIVARSGTHSEERKALPAGGTLRIALVTRRRALLRRLVDWARARGRPYDAPPEPTPAHVRQVGGAQARPEVESWAAAVEQAAFGPGEVDESIEKGVRDVEPGP